MAMMVQGAGKQQNRADERSLPGTFWKGCNRRLALVGKYACFEIKE